MALSGITIILNGHTYNDASFLNDGHQTAFLQALSDMLVEIQSVENFSASANASAVAATSSANSAAT
jgi:hypothetical protein